MQLENAFCKSVYYNVDNEATKNLQSFLWIIHQKLIKRKKGLVSKLIRKPGYQPRLVTALEG